MATYNRANFILESLEAIREQSFLDWECYIIDDGSTDNSAKVIEPILKNDHRFKYLTRTANYKKGLPGCRNYGLDIANGEFIVFMDDDDIPHPDLLKFCLQALKEYSVDFCRYERSVFHEKPPKKFNRKLNFEISKLGENLLEDMIIGKTPFNSCQILWKKICFKDIRFNENLMFAEEWECYTRILLKKAKGVSIKKTLFFARKHAHSNTGEFNKGDQIRKNSMIKATKLVLHRLSKHNKISEELKGFFIRLGFQLHDYSIIQKTLEETKSSSAQKVKYKLGYFGYPVIKPIFNLKSKFLKS